jgi:signal transduction histidine kinase
VQSEEPQEIAPIFSGRSWHIVILASIQAVPLLLGVLAAVALLLGGWWIRERRLGAQRRSVRAFHALSEDIIAATSPAGIAEKLAAVLPEVTRATGVELYLFDRPTKSLERVPTKDDPEPMAAPIDAPPEGLANAAVVCFRNRTLLSIPDVRRNPLVTVGAKLSLPRSALFVPLLSQQETLGVLQVENSRRLGYFSPEDQAALQHLANQVAASLKLQEQQRMREQLFHSEKLAATGQLISGVANELRAPLESIMQLAASLAGHEGRPVPEVDLRQLASEAQRASEIVARLVSFARHDQVSPQQVDVGRLVAGLMRFRDPEWRALGLRVQQRIGPEPALVLGVEGQIDQVFLNLLVHAEQHAAQSPGKTISVKTSVLGGRALVEIDYSTSFNGPIHDETEPDPTKLGLEVCQGIIRNHGGEIRLKRRSGQSGFEAELPVVRTTAEPPATAATNGSVRALTLMLVDSDPDAQRQLMSLLGARGHRVVPVAAEGAVDLAQRLRFDAVLWAVRSGAHGWSEFHERVRASIPAFVLISDGYNQELARSLEENGGYLLARPVQESALERILREMA